MPLPLLAHLVSYTQVSQQSYYDFRYDDEDTVLNEMEEFYSYVEMPQVAENLKVWEGSYPGGKQILLAALILFVILTDAPDWIKSPPAQRRAHIEVLLESLEHRDAEIRFTNARRLFYVLQGTHRTRARDEEDLF
jgi:N1221-like protein